MDEIEKLLVKAAGYGATNVLYRGYELLADRLAGIGRFEAALSARNQAAAYLKEYNLSKNQRMVQGQAVRFDVFQKEQQISLAEERIKSQRSQWVATLALIIVVSGGLWAWTYYRRKRKDLNQQRLLLEKETELQRKITEIEGQAFRAQMNPHFIFNALNSVKGLIVTGRDKEAAVYISRFSKLVRSVLDQSRNKTISLREELETLELYLQLEQLRFRDGFAFTNKVAADVNTEEIILPAVVIQPFAENSIWHGFRGNSRKNELVITVSVEAEFLIISIEDNGIGREAAAANAQKEHHSHGIEITRQRLLNFSGAHNTSVIHYEDLKTEDDKFALGTRVTLKIPLRYE
ncbi:hypothetical protein CEQ90_05900 [Lewinellaceae bacterium SD302]|nr:hypothetical protein CEQ90_05900 [Lewinellaceae bacterium SD302]